MIIAILVMSLIFTCGLLLVTACILACLGEP